MARKWNFELHPHRVAMCSRSFRWQTYNVTDCHDAEWLHYDLSRAITARILRVKGKFWISFRNRWFWFISVASVITTICELCFDHWLIPSVVMWNFYMETFLVQQLGSHDWHTSYVCASWQLKIENPCSCEVIFIWKLVLFGFTVDWKFKQVVEILICWPDKFFSHKLLT